MKVFGDQNSLGYVADGMGEALSAKLFQLHDIHTASANSEGDIESGLMAGLAGALNSVWLGGIGCLIGVGVTVVAFPELAAYEADAEIARLEREEAAGAVM